MDILKGIVAYLLVPLAGTAIVYKYAHRDCDKWIKLLFVYAIEAVVTRIFAGVLVLKMLKAFGVVYNDASAKYVLTALLTSVVLSVAYVLFRKAYTVSVTTENNAKENNAKENNAKDEKEDDKRT